MIRVQDIEGWALDLFGAEWHVESLLRYGERVVYLRRWQWEDYERGLVDKCSRCSAGKTLGLKERMNAVYGQTGDTFCEYCWGTGFEGGFNGEALITYMLAVDTEIDQHNQSKTGFSQKEKAEVQLPHMPVVRQNDLIMTFTSWVTETQPREPYGRYTVQKSRPETIRTGLEHNTSREQLVGWRAEIVPVPPESPLWRVPPIFETIPETPDLKWVEDPPGSGLLVVEGLPFNESPQGLLTTREGLLEEMLV